PHRAAAAVLPELTVPGVARLGEVLGLRVVLVGSARHREEAPQLLTVVGVISGDVAAHAELGAAVADDHFAIDHARRAGDRVGLVRLHGELGPEFLAAVPVERHETAVECAEVEPVTPGGHAAVDDVAARLDRDFAGHFRIILPQRLAGG